MLHGKMQSQGIKSDEKRTRGLATGKNGKQIHAVLLRTLSMFHEPEKTQSAAWPCGVFVDRF